MKSKASEVEIVPTVNTTTRNFQSTEVNDYQMFAREDDEVLAISADVEGTARQDEVTTCDGGTIRDGEGTIRDVEGDKKN